jgi:hypothetical protein
MVMARRAARVDDNQGDIVKALRDMGCSVLPLHTVGAGCPDLLIGYDTINLLLEVKDGSKVPSAQSLTPAQERFFDEWLGQAEVVNSPADACRYVTDQAGPW